MLFEELKEFKKKEPGSRIQEALGRTYHHQSK
jgi:hypothetical protein